MKWLALMVVLGACDKLFGLQEIPRPDVPPVYFIATPIAGGAAHTCRIRADSTLWCWGDNRYGQLGVSSTEPFVAQPRQVNSAQWKIVSSAFFHTCAIQTDDSLWCWGQNSFGQVGVEGDNQLAPIQIAGNWKRVSAGPYTTCAIDSADALYCWGLGDQGQRGDGTQTVSSAQPIRVGTHTWQDVANAYLSTCGVQTDRTLWCWGSGPYGELGNGTADGTPQPVPVQIAKSEMWMHVGAGVYHHCALTGSGRVRCWGGNFYGELGGGSRTNASIPISMLVDGDDRDDWIDIEVGPRHSCALRNDGRAWCWGTSGRGQLGLDGDEYSPPIELVGPTTWKSLALGAGQTCGLASDDEMYCLGLGAFGELGTGLTSQRAPKQVPGSWASVTTGGVATCATSTSGGAFCGGDATFYELGTGNPTSTRTLLRFDKSVWSSIAAGNSHACGVVADTVYCWGSNAFGQVGVGGDAIVPLPTPVTSGSVVVASDHACLNVFGTLQCWGRNDHGQVGIGTTDFVGSPMTIAGAGTSASVAVGAEHTCSVDSAGVLSCWGRGSEGQLCNNLSSDKYTPNVITVAGSFTNVAAGGYNACARNGTQTLACWGWNDHGETGNGATSVQANLYFLSGNWSDVAVGDHHVCGIKTNGTLSCWGSNLYGQLGVPTVLLESHVPVQVGTASDWVSVSAGARHTCGLRSGNALYCWGSNDSGQLVDGTAWRTTFERVP